MSAQDFEILRREMLAEFSASTFRLRETIGKATLDERVMAAIGSVPRHEFVPVELQLYAYANIPLPIGCDKTISQPFIVALMTDLLDVRPDDQVLEIGTGLGYQAAILARLARQVYSIEIIEELAAAGGAAAASAGMRATWGCASPTAITAGRSMLRSTR